jgi:hypothetical protein
MSGVTAPPPMMSSDPFSGPCLVVEGFMVIGDCANPKVKDIKTLRNIKTNGFFIF